MSPLQWPSSTERTGKEPHLEEPSLTISVNSEGHHQSPFKGLSETDDQASFMGSTSTLTPNKAGGGLHPCSSSNDSRHSMTPFEVGLYWSFSYPSCTGVHCSSITCVTIIAGSQQVNGSGWQPTRSFSPLLSQAMDTLSAEQATEIYQLAAECQALGSELTKQFQNLSRLETMHRAASQASAHETINGGCMAHSATFGIATATQTDKEWKSSMHRLCIKANQAWKDGNEVIFSHLLKYDTQLAAFISATEGTLQAKSDEIWRHVHSLTDTANIPHRICLPLALQTLDQLPAIPWDLSYHASIPLMFAYGPESYNFQTWSATRDGDYHLDNDAWATNLLSHKLVLMAGGAVPSELLH